MQCAKQLLLHQAYWKKWLFNLQKNFESTQNNGCRLKFLAFLQGLFLGRRQSISYCNSFQYTNIGHSVEGGIRFIAPLVHNNTDI